MGIGPERYERMLPRNSMDRRSMPQKVATAVIFLGVTPVPFIGGFNSIIDGVLTARVQH